MKKLFAIFLFGFITAQAMEYGASQLVYLAQVKCYPLWTEGKRDEYQQCMDTNKAEKLSRVVGFNFIYTARDLILGY